MGKLAACPTGWPCENLKAGIGVLAERCCQDVNFRGGRLAWLRRVTILTGFHHGAVPLLGGQRSSTGRAVDL
jgi:hypothetical protein